MTDYTKPTGTSGLMLIRDTGTVVEFWLNSNNSTTWSDHIPWFWAANGASGSGSYYYHPNSGWNKIASFNITYSQNVGFALGNTGTSGFGGPTDFNIPINRGTVPPPPTPVRLSSILSTSMVAQFDGQGDGGATILRWELSYNSNGVSPDFSTTIITSDGTSVLSGLTPGTTYYFWARGVNTQGFGGWSARTQATTQSVPNAPSTPVLSAVGATSMVVSWVSNGDGGSPITEFDLGYAFEGPDAPTSVVTSVHSPHTLINLAPGTQYWVWIRAQNVIGTGPYSTSPASAKTIAGARIKVGTDWKVAIPYVKVAGVWKLATPWLKDAGEWKETD